MKRILIGTVLCVSLSAFAQSSDGLSPEVCKGFADNRLMDTESYMSTDFNYRQHHEMVCRNTQRNTDTKFSMAGSMSSIVDFVPTTLGGALDFSRKKDYVDNYCRHIESLSEDHRRVAFSSQQFSANMRDTTAQCLDVVRDALLRRGAVFAYAKPNNTSLTEYLVSVEVRPNPRQMVELRGISAVNTSCTYGGRPLQIPMTLNLDGPTQFMCSKPHDEGTYLSIHTASMGDAEVRLPGRADMKFLEIESQIESLRSLVAAEARKEVVVENCEFPIGGPYTFSGQGHLHGLSNLWNHLDGELLADCPVGQVMVGVHSHHWNGIEDRQFRFKCCSVTLR